MFFPASHVTPPHWVLPGYFNCKLLIDNYPYKVGSLNQKLSILIVDDHPGMCRTLKDILEAEKYKVVSVFSGKAAISICEKQRFDVILLDFRMPDLNGVEIYLRIKNYTKGTRIIMMSAYSDDELKEKVLQLGDIAFLQKPLDIEKTLKLVKRAEPLSVLIVVENQQEREKLAIKLNQQNYRAFSTGRADEALSLAGQIYFNLIIIDPNLYTMRSTDLYLALKKITPTSVNILFAETEQNFLKQAEQTVKKNEYMFLEKLPEPDGLLANLVDLKRYAEGQIF